MGGGIPVLVFGVEFVGDRPSRGLAAVFSIAVGQFDFDFLAVAVAVLIVVASRVATEYDHVLGIWLEDGDAGRTPMIGLVFLEVSGHVHNLRSRFVVGN